MEEYEGGGIYDMEDRFALLIDADNVSAKYIQPILDELSNTEKSHIKESTGTGPGQTMQAGRKNFYRTQSRRFSSSAILMGKMRRIRR